MPQLDGAEQHLDPNEWEHEKSPNCSKSIELPSLGLVARLSRRNQVPSLPGLPRLARWSTQQGLALAPHRVRAPAAAV